MEVLPGAGSTAGGSSKDAAPLWGRSQHTHRRGAQGAQARPVVRRGQGLCEPGCDPERGPGSLPAPPAQRCPRGPSPPRPSLLGSRPAGLRGPGVSSLTEALTSADVRLGSPGLQGLCELPEALDHVCEAGSEGHFTSGLRPGAGAAEARGVRALWDPGPRWIAGALLSLPFRPEEPLPAPSQQGCRP